MSRAPGGRLLWRLAWREARAAPLRHGLVVGLVALAVAAAVVAAVGQRTGDPSEQERQTASFGAADLIVSLNAPRPAYEQLPAALQREVDERLGGPVDVPTATELERLLADAGSEAAVVRLERAGLRHAGTHIEVLAGDVADPVLDGLLAGDLDAAPAAGEALASPGLLSHLEVEVGDELALPGLAPARVVGIAADPLRRSRPLLVVPATAAPSAATPRWFVGGLDAASAHELAERLREELGAQPTLVGGPEGVMRPTPGPEVGVHTEVRAPRPDAPEMVLEGRVREGQRATLLGAAVAVVLLVQVGLVAAATFATGARRQIRQLGLLAAVGGAAPVQLRRLVRRQAIVLGLAGAAAGLAVGLGGLRLGLGLLERAADRPLDGLVVRPADLLLPAGLALLAIVAAAWLPARTVGRAPVTTALAGRVPLRRVPRWLAPTAIVTALVGAGLLVAAQQLGAPTGPRLEATTWPPGGGAGWLVDGVRRGGTALGVVLLLAGGAGLAAPAIALTSRLADRLRLPARLALRDSVRQRPRSAATVAATMAVLVVPVIAAVGAATADRADELRHQRARDDVALVRGPTYAGLQLSVTDDLLARARAAAPGEAEVLRVPLLEEVELLTPTQPAPMSDDPPAPPSDVAPTGAPPSDAHAQPADPQPSPPAAQPASLGPAAVATAGVLELVGVNPHDLEGTVVAVRRSFGDPRLRDLPERGLLAVWDDGRLPGSSEAGAIEVEVVLAPRTVGWDFPRLLVPEPLAAALGAPTGAELAALHLDAAPAAAEEQAMREAGRDAAVPFAIGTPPTQHGPALGTVVATVGAAAALVAVIIAALTAALAATESDRDLRTMAAVGGDPRLRPRVRAVQAGYHALLAGVLAVPVGLLLTAALQPAALPLSGPLAVPWPALLTLVLGTATIVAVALRLGSRRAAVHLPQRRPT